MNKAIVTIIIPTYNNREQLIPCINSIQRTALSDGLISIIVINNGEAHTLDDLNRKNYLEIVDAGKNLGWESGLKKGIEMSDSEYVMFLNDDILIPDSSSGWIQKMLQHFIHPEVGAVGPSSNVVMGSQNMVVTTPKMIFCSSFLIGFCMMVRRKALIDAGGIDDSLNGGDDLDLSIRLDDKGYLLMIDRNVFVYHYGFQTGTRLFGDHTKKGGWNNYLYTERVNFNLIKKHGFRRWYEMMIGITKTKPQYAYSDNRTDTEGDIIRSLITKGKIYEFGCGAQKTVPEAVGFDLVPKGHKIESLSDAVSVADECFDVSKPFPEKIAPADCIIARHILEHCIDVVATLKNWKRQLNPSGKLIIALPNQNFWNTIPVNIEHVHAFTPESAKSLLEEIGFKKVNIYDANNGVSFVAEGTNI